MLISIFRKKDMIYESLASFPQAYSDEPIFPIFRLRAVLLPRTNNKYSAILRLYSGMDALLMSDDRNGKGYTLKKAQSRAIVLLLNYLQEQSRMEETSIIQEDGTIIKLSDT